ncbi:unnamed protein product [Haemonchus placei]|uniref:Uncharacterized protein n=1 Tax=Haemonchus placei TaxID=6290 RepID=A0A0N4W6V3_HAEPC|nr:unnamed protein product [Haemonchus placei]
MTEIAAVTNDETSAYHELVFCTEGHQMRSKWCPAFRSANSSNEALRQTTEELKDDGNRLPFGKLFQRSATTNN